MVNLIQGKYEVSKNYYTTEIAEDCFEFNFTHVSSNEIFREIDRFIWESKHLKTRFRNRYSGPVLINLTEWNKKPQNSYFDAFIYFLKDNTQLSCTFLVEDICDKSLLEKLVNLFELNVIELEVKKHNDETRRIGFFVEEEKQ